MTTHGQAMHSICEQLFAHSLATERPIAPVDQVDYSLCEDLRTVLIDLYLVDGFHAMATYLPASPVLPCQWTR